MNTNKKSLEDLKIMLSAIRIARSRWLNSVHVKAVEAHESKPGMDEKTAFLSAIGTDTVQEAFQALITLYGVLGSQSEEFEKALEGQIELVESAEIQTPKRILRVA